MNDTKRLLNKEFLKHNIILILVYVIMVEMDMQKAIKLNEKVAEQGFSKARNKMYIL